MINHLIHFCHWLVAPAVLSLSKPGAAVSSLINWDRRNVLDAGMANANQSCEEQEEPHVGYSSKALSPMVRLA